MLCNCISAQSPCGIDHNDIELITKRLKLNKKTIEEGFISQRNGAITWLPVKFHLIAKTGGTQRIGEEHVLRQLNLLNENYIDQEIQFYIDGDFNYIDNTGAFDNPSSGAGNLILSANKLNGRINIFIPKTAMTGGGSLGTTLGFYSPNNDWIVIRQAELLNLTSTLTHEMGHFLSLLHPHNGWDSVNYDVGDHTPTPVTAPGGVLTENEARTGSCKNCEIAGDYLCDTPPDYNFGFGWNDCDYDRGTLDPCGEVVDVQEDNYMGYFGDCNSYVFTNQQKELMEVDVTNRNAANTIFSNLEPTNIDTITGEILANFPENGGASYLTESVYFNWTPVEGATHYIFDVAREVTGFSSGTRVIVDGGKSEVSITAPFIENAEYIWRVYPYNQYDTGFNWSEEFSFFAGSATSVATINEIASYELYPNLVGYQNEVVVDINATESFDVNLQVINLAGQIVSQKSVALSNGDNKIDLNVEGMSNGVYFVKIASAKGTLSKKLIIQRS